MSDGSDVFEAWVRGGQAAGDCPPAEAIWEAAHGELAPGSVRSLVDHVSGCSSCAADWAVAVEVQREMPADTAELLLLDKSSPMRALDKSSPSEALDRSSPLEASDDNGVSLGSMRSRGWAAAGGFALAAAALLAVMSGAPGPTDEPVYRDGVDRIELLTPENAVLAREAVRIEWSSEPGWTYDVLVSDDALNTLHTAQGIDGDHVVVPAEAIASLPEGALLLWRVEGLGPDGTRRISRTSVLRIQ
ncbi:MAG: hypothetical protein KC912_10055 [Proteobacteria bacterium]|nr:hypothetical protein [Pseudomonadota bacterium]